MSNTGWLCCCADDSYESLPTLVNNQEFSEEFLTVLRNYNDQKPMVYELQEEDYKRIFPSCSSMNRVLTIATLGLYGIELPIASLETFVDEYFSLQQVSDFPIVSLYVNIFGKHTYRTLSCRIQVPSGPILDSSFLCKYSAAQYGCSKLTACQYVVATGNIQCFHTKNQVPIEELLRKHPEAAESIQERFPDIKKMLEEVKDRGALEFVMDSWLKDVQEKPEEMTLQSMFEFCAYNNLNYVGAPIVVGEETVGVCCVCHRNEFTTADDWVEQTKIKNFAGHVAHVLSNRAFALVAEGQLQLNVHPFDAWVDVDLTTKSHFEGSKKQTQ